MTKTPDWNAYAIKQANRAKTLCRYVDRSVAPGQVPDLAKSLVFHQNDEGQFVRPRSFKDLGLAVFFGNDGFLQSAKVRAEVSVLRQLLGVKGITVLGFGLSDTGKPKGKSWALVVGNDDLPLLGTILNAANGLVFYRESRLLRPW